MTIKELTTQTENQASLLRELIKSHTADLKLYPTGNYSYVSTMRIEHCYETLLRLNELLAKPIEIDIE
jgi:hypothetical protein